MAEPRWYFGYGSNMCREIFLEQRKMRPLSTKIGRLDGYELCFDIPIGPGERGVANLRQVPRAQTWGVLHLLEAHDFERLDNSEGVSAGFYRHIEVAVAVDGIDPLQAIAYQSSYTTTGRKPSPRYIGLLLAGAHENQLPEPYIRYLESFELAIDERVDANRPDFAKL